MPRARPAYPGRLSLDLPDLPHLLIMIVMRTSLHLSSARSAPRPVAPGRRSVLAAGLVAPLALALSACGAQAGSDRPLVVVSCYGIEYAARLVAGDAAEVASLAKPGQEPHDLELSVSEIAGLEKAEVIIRIPGFQTALDEAITSRGLEDRVLDVSTVVTLLPVEEHAEDHGGEETGADGHEGHDHGGLDPHMWTDPTLLAALATALGEHLGAVAPEEKETFTASAAEAVRLLEELDAELQQTFGAVEGEKVFVTSHTAFGYLAQRYGLEQIGISGIDPEVEPSPQRLLELQQVISERGVTTVFFEESASPKVAETLAQNVGVSSVSLDNLETHLDASKDYRAVMRENAAKLVESWA